MTDAAALALAAQRMIGTPFRPRGRSLETGIDCIGLVVLALAQIGRPVPPFPRYTMQNLDIAQFIPAATRAGLIASERAAVGDIILVRPSAAQYHLAILGPCLAPIHAHAGLRRVVASPPPLPWPLAMRWRLAET